MDDLLISQQLDRNLNSSTVHHLLVLRTQILIQVLDLPLLPLLCSLALLSSK